VVLFVGNMLVSDSALDYVQDNLDVLWKVPLAVALLALFYTVVGLAVASLTERRIVAGAAIIGLLLVTSITAGVLVGDDTGFDDDGSPAALINVLALPLYLRDIIFFGEPESGSPLRGVEYGGLLAALAYAVVVVVAGAVLVSRYRWVEK